MRLQIDHSYPCDRESFEYAFACNEIEEKLDVLHEVRDRKILSWTDDGKKFRRVSHYNAKARVPKIVEKVLRRDLSAFTQIMEYDRSTHRGWYEMHSEALGKRFTYRSDFSIEPEGDGGVVRKSALTFEIKIPALGGQLEKMVKRDMERLEKAEWEIYERFIREDWPRIKERVMADWPPPSAAGKNK